MAVGDSDVCPAATDGGSPVVSLTPNEDGTALLSWCMVTDATGYNLFLNNAYHTTVDSSTFSATVEYDGSQQYQVARSSDGNYPSKSDVAVAVTDTPFAHCKRS